MNRLVAVVVWVVVAGAVGAQGPELSYVSPSAVTPGGTTVVTFHGMNLAGVVSLWTSFPAKAERMEGGGSGQVSFRVSVAKDVPVGIAGVRVGGKNGVSSLMLVLVDDLPTITASGNNRTGTRAQRIDFPEAVDGVCEPGASQFYRFEGKCGQRVSAEVVAQRLGSQLDPVVRVTDSGGRELAYCDDEEGLGGDCRTGCVLPADGEYVVEVRDTKYDGGPEYRYRLRVGDFPLVTAPFPLGRQGDTEAEFVFCGPDIEGVTPIKLVMPTGVDKVALGPKRLKGKSSAIISAVVGRWAEVVEEEPNDTPATATVVALPGAVDGRLGRAGDRDWYQFGARKGQKIIAKGMTRSLGCPCDAVLKLTRPDGGVLAESKPTAADEGSVSAVVPADGVYRLMVQDIAGRGGPEMAYRVEINADGAFSLSADVEKIETTAAATFEVPVTCTREGYTGEIKLAVDGVEGLLVEKGVIDTGKDSAKMRVKLPVDVRPGVYGFRISGRGGDAPPVRVSTAPALKKLWPTMPYPPGELDGWIGLGVR